MTEAQPVNETEYDQEITDHIEEQANKRKEMVEKLAHKRIKKMSREIKRLEKHAQACLLADNKEGYIYSIGKLRGIINKPVTRDVMESLYKTSREEALKIIASFEAAKTQA